MDSLPVLLRSFRSGSNLTPSVFANNTSFIIPRIIELLFPSEILLSFRSFKMMPTFPPQGSFLVASYLFKNTNSTVYLTANAWSKRGHCLSFSYLRYWLTSEIYDGATTICSSSRSVLTFCSYFSTSLFLRGGIPFFFLFVLSLPYPKGMVELVLLFPLTIKKK